MARKIKKIKKLKIKKTPEVLAWGPPHDRSFMPSRRREAYENTCSSRLETTRKTSGNILPFKRRK